jgi:HEAT repeat protein
VSRIALAILIGLFCCGPAVNSAAQTRKIDSPELLKQLIAKPAPTPRTGAPQVPPELIESRPPTFYYRNNTPPDDAAIADLIEYWAHWANNNNHQPSKAVQKRLLEACAADPSILATFLNHLPDADSTPAKVKSIYDKVQTDPTIDQEWRDKVRRWLVFNSTYFLDELIALAHKAKDNQRDGDVDKEEALTSLAYVSWSHAEPLLRGLMVSGQPRAAALALSLFYEHAVDEKDLANEERYRRDLQAIASNRTQPGFARNVAVESLSTSEWSGRDDWYLSLFQDETLFDVSDGEYSLSPLTTLFNSDLEKWIPIMSRLVESSDMNVRSAAAACLVRVDEIQDEETARKAFRPLLPWLTNPAWANDNSNNRLHLIQSLGNIKVPESVTGLIWIIENDDSTPAYSRGFAADSLALYQDARAVPVLKRALQKEKDEGQRQRIIKGLLGSNGLTEKEQLEALEEYAARLTSAESRMDIVRYRGPQEEPLSPTLSIGKYLGLRETPSESLISAVLARAEELKSDNAPLSAALLEITTQWQGQQIERDIIRRISNGSADSAAILQALQRKEKMREGLRTELEGLMSVAGAAQGIGAVLLDDPVLAQGILNSEDLPAQVALLACSRLTQTPLPVEMVGPFLKHKDSLLTAAAENYLLADDSVEAREMLWQHHPNQSFVTGWRENLFSGYGYEGLSKSEDDLRNEILKENGPIEILAYMTNLTDQGKVLRIYSDKAVYTEYEDAARYRERTIPGSEVAALKDFITTRGLAERGPTIMYCHHGCGVEEFLLLTKEKGRRVFNQGTSAEWAELADQFVQLGTGDGAKVHYKLQDKIKGLEVLYAGELHVSDVAQQGGQLRILVERPETKEEGEERQATYDANEEDDEELELQLVRRRVELANARLSWRVFANDQVGAITSHPDFYSSIDPTRFITGDENDLDWEVGLPGQLQPLGPDSIVFVQSYEGLYRQFAGTKAVRIGSENAAYSFPIVTRDGKWVIVAKQGEEGTEPAHVVRLNLQSGREFRVNMPTAEKLIPIIFLPSFGKVLVKRARADYVPAGAKAKGPERAEYFLVDPATGIAQPATGDFGPLSVTGDRFLQPTEKPDEFWAAKADDKKNHTQVGRYSLKDFSFKPLMTVPQIMFDSMSTWVDAGQRKVYVVYQGQLLRLPLPATEPPAGVTKK